MVLTAVICLGLVAQTLALKGSVVIIGDGGLQGEQKTLRGQVYEQFLGIPFATPPVGELRWQKPIRPPQWLDIRDATKYGPVCTQNSVPEGQEDCLYLNVYVPGVVDRSASLPVMVYIHGGGFVMGSADQYEGFDLALTGDVIVVNFNYRLGVTGFLSTGDENAPGNYGLWDQIFALEWVQQNIENFGGDASTVTIFGESAGGSSVSVLAVSPPARGLFHRVLALSGSAAADWAVIPLVQRQSRNLGIVYQCEYWDSSRLVECLRRQNASSLEYYGSLTPLIFNQHQASWGPRVDGPGGVVPEYPRNLVEQGANADYDLLASYVQDDAAFIVFFGTFIDDPLFPINSAQTPQLLDFVMRLTLQIYRNPNQLMDLLYEHDPGLQSADLQVRTRSAIDGVNGLYFTEAPHYEAAQHAKNTQTNGKRTYLMEFHYLADWLQDRYPGYDIGAIHVDDLYFTFGEGVLWMIGDRSAITEKDRKVMDDTMKYFANFAYTGNPNEGPHKLDTFWPEYDDDTQEKLVLDYESRVRKVSPAEQEQFDFYRDVFYPAIEYIIPNEYDYKSHEEIRNKIENVKRQFDRLQPSERSTFYDRVKLQAARVLGLVR